MDNWQSQGGTWLGTPRAVRVNAYRIVLFAVGPDHEVYSRWRTPSGWGDWESLGGPVMGEPVAVSAEDGEGVELLCVGHDHSLVHRRWNGRAWSLWQPLRAEAGGVYVTPPELNNARGGRIDVLLPSAAGGLRHTWRTKGGWHAWNDLSGGTIGPPRAVRRTPEHLDVVACGADGRLLHRFLGKNGWSDWEVTGDSPVGSVPCLVACGPERFEAFFLGPDRMLYRQIWDHGWSDVVCLEGTVLEPPVAIWSPKRGIDVFVVGEDRAIWHMPLLHQGKSWWRPIGGQAYSGISAVTGDERVELFVLGRDSSIRHRTVGIPSGGFA